MDKRNKTERSVPVAPGGGAIRWNTEGTKSSYCNVANAISTRETVILNFGLSQSVAGRSAEMGVDLLHRVVVAPLTAKHLLDLLSRLIAEHDAHSTNPR